MVVKICLDGKGAIVQSCQDWLQYGFFCISSRFSGLLYHCHTVFAIYSYFSFQNLGIFNSTVIQESLEQVRRETNFNGINIVSNYAETFPPFGYADEFGKPKGIFYDVLKIAAQSINLTVNFQKPKKENYNIWLKR